MLTGERARISHITYRYYEDLTVRYSVPCELRPFVGFTKMCFCDKILHLLYGRCSIPIPSSFFFLFRLAYQVI